MEDWFMTMLQGKKTYLCIPIGLGLPIVFLLLTVLSIVMTLWVIQVEQNDVAPIFGFFALLAFSIALVTLVKTTQRVEIQSEAIVCKGLLPGSAFSIEYEKCTIGMDWHKQNGNLIWWIYLCYGHMPIYRNNNPHDRINSLRCRPGFIRIMYRDDVYQALITVLPKKQRVALETSRRFSGFDKQGKI